MSIRDRTEDAAILWRCGRKEGAWVLALVAVAATARKRYPRPLSDNEAFKRFIRDIVPTLIYGKPPTGFPLNIAFDKTPLEDIIYEHLRCNLFHEAEASRQIAFSESKIIDGEVKGTLTVGAPNEIPGFWVLNLLKAVRESPENADEFGSAP